jgi:hypothetical protein
MSVRQLMFVALVVAAGPAAAQTLSVSPSAVTGCKPATATLSLPAVVASDTVFTLSSNNASATVPPSVTVLAGQQTATFTVSTIDVASQAIASISATDGTSTASRNLTLRTLAPTAMVMTPNRIGPGSTSTGTVTLTCAPTLGDVTVSLASNNVAASVPATVTVAQGTASATFTATAASVTSQTAVSITATTSGGSRSTTLTIKPPTVTGLAFVPSTPVGGTPSTGTITLDFPAGAGGLTVTLSSSNAAVAATDVASVVIAEGASTATFGLTTTGVINDTDVIITATANAVPFTRSVRVRKNRIENFNPAATTLTACRDLSATVKLVAPAGPDGVTIAVTNSRPDLATLSTTSLVIPPGEQRATFTAAAAGPITTNTTLDIAVVFTRSATDVQTETETFQVVRTSAVACQ